MSAQAGWVGSLWVSMETGAGPEEAPPISLYAQLKTEQWKGPKNWCWLPHGPQNPRPLLS